MMYQIAFLVILYIQLISSAIIEPFSDTFHWVTDTEFELDRSISATFTVALKLRDVESMRQEFLEVSSPKSSKYGKFYDLKSLQNKYGPYNEDKKAVIRFFQSIPGAKVHEDSSFGDMFTVTASIEAIEDTLMTSLSWKKHKYDAIPKRSIRADSHIYFPDEISDHIAFISLTTPVTHVISRGSNSLKKAAKDNQEEEEEAATLSVTKGNQEALIYFQPICGDGTLNVASPPCTNLAEESYIPIISISATEYSNSATDSYILATDPLQFNIPSSQIYCYNTTTGATCDGSQGDYCNCIAKIAPLPKYTQLRANVTYSFPSSATTSSLGSTSLFALTDTATPATLSVLYNIPEGITVHYGSNQSVAEFYGEFYSNSDLSTFLALSGLPNASIPNSNVFGDLANNQNDPGGEAQLDVEYIMALGQGADTFFYSFSDLNPYDSSNEGFLAYLTYVNNQEYPPLVHSLSYGDVEASVFNTSNNGSIAYGERCDQEFMKMGLRGLTVVFSSGDDGIGNYIIRTDPDYACIQAYPSWPASSPYVTSVGATQLTNKYLPVCGDSYAVSSAYPDLPQENQLLFQCTAIKETTCSSTIGGVITSGGGFSNYANRQALAPWQQSAVNAYLQQTNAIPPTYYFNTSGRAYPDVATYGSNYFVYLGGSIVRESGTSASAPVFAAMVTLWNDMRLAYGYSPLGFIAPFLYDIYATTPEAFHDITTGNNACGVGSSIETVNCCEYYFSAAPGWDAVTGLGSPDFQIIANLVLDSSNPFPSISTSSVLNNPATEESSSDNNDNDVQVTAALVLGSIALAFSLITSGLLIYLLFFSKSSVMGRTDVAEPFISG